jgi:Glycosyl hydrolase catalytic core
VLHDVKSGMANSTSPDFAVANMTSQILSKRGLGWSWNNPASHFPLYQPAISSSKLSWLFNWEMWAPPNLPKGLEYIPQVRLGNQAEQIDAYLTTLERERGGVGYLLGFNEPDIDSQANMSVEQAVELWMKYVIPAKRKFGFRLGAPAVSSDPKGKRWLEEFFTQTKGKDEVDFVVVHWYGSDAKHMQWYLRDMHGAFGKPLWLTEFACSHMGSSTGLGTEEVETFLRDTLPWLDGHEYVERYAYFGAPADVGEWVGRANNFTEASSIAGKMRLSRVGKAYVQL